MTLEKWINNFTSEEKKKKREEMYGTLTKEGKVDLKKQKIKEIVTKSDKVEENTQPSKEILNDILKFKNWLNNRNYIAGDLERIEIWIKNLYHKLNLDYEKQNIQESEKGVLLRKYREIPPDFLQEKIRIALNKKLKGMKGSSSDAYYLKKLRNVINEKLREAEYYEILRKILES